MQFALPVLLMTAFFATFTSTVYTKDITLSLRTRDAQTNDIKTNPLTIDPRKVGIVIVDAWNYHWCMTWTEQAGGMTPRMNRALQGCRTLGMTVFWGPTDTAGMFSGWPQRQRAMAFPNMTVPNIRKAECHWTVPWGDCLCGPGFPCIINYGFDGMDPRLEIFDNDLIISGTQELYSICKAKGITHLIYFGGATNICLTGKDIGLGPLYAAGLETIFARDMAFAWTHYDPDRNYTPSTGNAQAADDLERAGIPTVILGDELRRLNLWNEDWITEPVRITPAGKPDRPYLFERSVAVWLDIPYLEQAEIYYTLDGSEPTKSSLKFDRPITITETTSLHAAAFQNSRKVSLGGLGYFVRMPVLPPKPDVPLDRLAPVPDLYGKVNPTFAACLWEPQKNVSFEGQPLRIRNMQYERGYGMRAPAYLRYDLLPEWSRFVALAGVDDRMLDRELGRSIAMYPSVVFKVFIDGQLMAESPVMRISQVPWRFDIPIPPNARQIVLVCDDAGSRSPYDLGDWVETGFILEK